MYVLVVPDRVSLHLESNNRGNEHELKGAGQELAVPTPLCIKPRSPFNLHKSESPHPDWTRIHIYTEDSGYGAKLCAIRV